ncbi:MAG: DUF4199 domain-containing protein [Alistipes sp.]|nr:DUF4199 domain-containing protein [Alistipes sp.]
MNKSQFWNETAKKGAVLGALLALSAIFEMWVSISGKHAMLWPMTIEWIAVAVLHYYLLHRYTKQYSLGFSDEVGFTFWQGYGYQMILSAFAGVIVGVVQSLMLHGVIGYSNYIERVMNSTQQIIASSGAPMSNATQSMLAQAFEQVQQTQEPSVLSTAWGSMVNALLFAALFGLIIAGVTARAPRLFGGSEQQE